MVKVQRLFAKTNLKIRVCGAKWNNESPSGAFKRQNSLAAGKMEGPRPDKFQFAVQRQTEEKPLHSKTDAGAFSLFTSR